MPQVSARKLTPDKWRIVWGVFVDFIAQINKKQSQIYLPILLTDTEQIMLSKRFLITVLQSKGYTPKEVAGYLKMSKATVYKTMVMSKLYPEYLSLIKQKFANVKINEGSDNTSSYLENLIEDLAKGRRQRWRMFRPTER